MIKLTNVTKTYVSKKKKQRVDALKGINFELGNSGMVFILGKSGSGKSTLLNMLGGLDSPTEGEIVVDGVSMKDFKQADYEGYRNGYVGFIFQEFNLLDEFNVKDNIALALRLSKDDNIDEKVVTALQQVELNEDYLTRRVDEMSGGEKQRVAIARTIVKESKMILADEPTGNLDAATGESIWNILKAQSQTKLVVVVSHDRESAEKYGDRIIEIADGNVIADTGMQNIDNGVEEIFTPQKKKLSFLTCLKMGVNSLFRRKVRSIGVLLLSILSILTLIITQLCLCYSVTLTDIKFIQKYNVDYFGIQDNIVPRKGDLAFLEENSANIKTVGTIGIVKGKQDILDMGWTFVGEAMELDDNSYYLSTRRLKEIEEALNNPFLDHSHIYFYLDDNGDKIFIPEIPDSWEFVIGKKTNLVEYIDNSNIIAGIVDVSSASDFATSYMPRYFVLEGFTNYNYFPSDFYLYKEDGFLEFGNERYNGESIFSDGAPHSSEIVITESGLVKPSNVTIGEGEIVISYEMLEAFFNAKSAGKYVTMLNRDFLLRETPEQIGQTYSFALYDESGEQVVDFGELKIIGVGFNISRGDNVRGYLNIKDMSNIYTKACRSFLVKTSSVGNVRSFITNLSQKRSTLVSHAGYIQYIESSGKIDCAELANRFTDFIRFLTIIIGPVSIIMILILILLVTNLITLSITGRKKEIGILSALGTSNKDIAKIFIFETLVIAVITFVIVLIASLIFASVFNVLFSERYFEVVLTAPLFNVDVLTIVTLIVSSFGFLLLGALLPLRRIAKLKPIDAIRNV